MRNFDGLKARDLLSNHSPELLFSRKSTEAKQEYRALALIWHPDHSKDAEAGAVFGHIASLYREALNKQKDGSWIEPFEKLEAQEPGLKKFRLSSGEIISFEYLSIRSFELGLSYIGEHSVLFELRKEFYDLFCNGKRQMLGLRFENEAMCLEMANCLPQIQFSDTCENSCLLSVRKTPDQLLLADLLKQFPGKIEPIEHVGWILNVLYNIACYLSWSGLSHNAISPETVFVSPLRHSGMLLGGWWYARPRNARLIALPDFSLDFIPEDMIREKTADSRADLELIKAVGRSLLGDAAGASLHFDEEIPESISSFLRLPSTGKAVADYKEWKYNVLEDAFGAPRFVPMNLTSKDLYKEI